MKKIKPMLCEASLPFSDDRYMFEIKWDGERAILFYEDGELRIQNRKGDDITFRYPELKQITRELNCDSCIVDGEIVCLDSEGKSNFSLIAQRSHLLNKFEIEMRSKNIPSTFMAFDLIEVNGKDLRSKPLIERKELLYRFIKPLPPFLLWSLCLEKDGNGLALFETVKRMGLEGIVGKFTYSPYLEGKRSPYWKKVKCEKTLDIWFISYSENPAGIRIEDEKGIAIQVAGKDSQIVKQEIDSKGKCLVEVKYLEETENKRLRMPTYKGIK